ncbi:MAG: hypothetical protein ACYDHP_11050 [Ferrimicrobium sp.]
MIGVNGDGTNFGVGGGKAFRCIGELDADFEITGVEFELKPRSLVPIFGYIEH